MNGELRHGRKVGVVRMARAGQSLGRTLFAFPERALTARAKIDEGLERARRIAPQDHGLAAEPRREPIA